MHLKVLVLAVAVGLGLASATAAAANPTDATPASNAQESEVAALKRQLAELAARLADLETRNDAQSGINIGTGQAVEALQTTSAKVEKLVNNTSLGGKLFIDTSYLNQKNRGVKTDASGVGIDVKRFYLSVTHNFDPIWSANLTTDFNYVANDGETNLFVKKAYLQGKFSNASVLRVGSSDTPWIPYVESLYGYRYVENTLVDRLKFGNSADWGVHYAGKLPNTLNYAVSAVNGGGFRNPSRSKRMDFEGRLGFSPITNLVLAVGGYSGTLGKETQSRDSEHTANRVNALAAYTTTAFRIGGEYFRAWNWNNVLTAQSDKADGYSFWTSVPLSTKATAFARYDHADTSKTLNSSLSDEYINFGVEFPITTGMKLSTVYKHSRLKNDSRSVNVKSDEIGVWGEFAF